MQQLSALSATYPELGNRLAEATRKLRDTGTPPSTKLVEELVAYRRNFTNVQTQILERASSASVSPLPVAGEDVSIDRLKQLLQQSANVGETDVRASALNILDRLLSITHTDDPNFPPLADCQAKARQLRQQVEQAPSAEIPQYVRGLAEGKHAFSVLLTLVEQWNNLDDQQWSRLADVVVRGFGQPMAIAASRGKLKVSGTPAAARPPQSTEVPSAATSNVQMPAPAPQPPATPSQGAPSTATAQTAGGAEEDIFVWGDAPAQGQPAAPPQTPPPTPAPPSEEAEQPIVFGAKSLGLEESSAPAVSTPMPASVSLKVTTRIAGLGDREFKQEEFAGTRGQSRAIEGFQINQNPPVSGLRVEYMAHLSGVGDTPWMSEGQWVGVRGESHKIEGFAIRLSGEQASKYNVFYMGHIQNIGDSPVASNGQFCGTRGQSLQVEGLKVWIAPR